MLTAFSWSLLNVDMHAPSLCTGPRSFKTLAAAATATVNPMGRAIKSFSFDEPEVPD
jgi:hypothetical protein